jgi:hypothetical protein
VLFDRTVIRGYIFLNAAGGSSLTNGQSGATNKKVTVTVRTITGGEKNKYGCADNLTADGTSKIEVMAIGCNDPRLGEFLGNFVAFFGEVSVSSSIGACCREGDLGIGLALQWLGDRHPFIESMSPADLIAAYPQFERLESDGKVLVFIINPYSDGGDARRVLALADMLGPLRYERAQFILEPNRLSAWGDDNVYPHKMVVAIAIDSFERKS